MVPRILLLTLLAAPLARAEPVNILSIGDSLTEEYEFEFPFSAPATGQPDDHARNWPELIEARRADEGNFGTYKGRLGDYSDLRNAGYRLNFGIPSRTADDWIDIINQTSFDPFNNSADDEAYYRTREALIDNLPLADIAVIFLGGNDLKNVYADIFNDTEPPGFFDTLLSDLETIHAFVRDRHPDLPVVVATVPDVGATPDVYQTYDDESRQRSTRAKIAAFNQNLITTFDAKSDTAVARVDHLTDRVLDIVIDGGVFELNGTEFTLPGDPDNPPDHLFCKDDFHPNTAAQALVTNEIMSAMNELLPGTFTPLPNREILGAILGLDPDQPYLDWIAGHDPSDDAMSADPDGDGLPNLAEMLLDTPPDQPDDALNGPWAPGGSIGWQLHFTDYLAWFPEESPDLATWTEIPESRLTTDTGTVTAEPDDDSPNFFRLRVEPAP